MGVEERPRRHGNDAIWKKETDSASLISCSSERALCNRRRTTPRVLSASARAARHVTPAGRRTGTFHPDLRRLSASCCALLNEEELSARLGGSSTADCIRLKHCSINPAGGAARLMERESVSMSRTEVSHHPTAVWFSAHPGGDELQDEEVRLKLRHHPLTADSAKQLTSAEDHG